MLYAHGACILTQPHSCLLRIDIIIAPSATIRWKYDMIIEAFVRENAGIWVFESLMISDIARYQILFQQDSSPISADINRWIAFTSLESWSSVILVILCSTQLFAFIEIHAEAAYPYLFVLRLCWVYPNDSSSSSCRALLLPPSYKPSAALLTNCIFCIVVLFVFLWQYRKVWRKIIYKLFSWAIRYKVN